LTIAGIFIAERRWHDAKVFQARTGPPAGKPTRGLNWPGQSARLAPEQGKRPPFHARGEREELSTGRMRPLMSLIGKTI
jgi:hypothetical protein